MKPSRARKRSSSVPSKVRKLRDGGGLSLRKVHLGAGFSPQFSQTSGRLSLTVPFGPSRVKKPSPSLKASVKRAQGLGSKVPSVFLGADYKFNLK